MKKSYLVLLTLVATIFAGYWIHEWWANRGLITMDAKDAPILQVLHKMERQSGFAILARTNLTQKVTVHFRRTPVEEALGVLADQVEGRWQKVFLVGRDKASIRKLASGVAQQGTPFLITAMGPMGDMMENLEPEKLQKGPVKPLVGPHPLQEAALAVAVRSATPVVVQADLNPMVRPSASTYPNVGAAVGDLASAAAARWEQAYQFRTWGRGGRGGGEGGGFGSFGGSGRGGGEGGEGRGFRMFGGGDDGNTNNPFAAQSALLPPEQQAAMEKARAEMQQRIAEFMAMSPADRAQRMADIIDGGGSAARQQRAQQRALQRIMNTTPEQQTRSNQRFEQRLQRIQQQMQQGSAPTPAPKPQGGK